MPPPRQRIPERGGFELELGSNGQSFRRSNTALAGRTGVLTFEYWTESDIIDNDTRTRTATAHAIDVLQLNTGPAENIANLVPDILSLKDRVMLAIGCIPWKEDQYLSLGSGGRDEGGFRDDRRAESSISLIIVLLELEL
jgi:hypothetical protein